MYFLSMWMCVRPYTHTHTHVYTNFIIHSFLSFQAATWSFYFQRKKVIQVTTPSHSCFVYFSTMMDIRILPKFFGLRLCHYLSTLICAHTHTHTQSQSDRENFYLFDHFSIIHITFWNMLFLSLVISGRKLLCVLKHSQKRDEKKEYIHNTHTNTYYNIVSLTTLVLFNVVPKYSLIFVAAAAAAAVVCTLFVRFFFSLYLFLSSLTIHSVFLLYLPIT